MSAYTKRTYLSGCSRRRRRRLLRTVVDAAGDIVHIARLSRSVEADLDVLVEFGLNLVHRVNTNCRALRRAPSVVFALRERAD